MDIERIERITTIEQAVMELGVVLEDNTLTKQEQQEVKQAYNQAKNGITMKLHHKYFTDPLNVTERPDVFIICNKEYKKEVVWDEQELRIRIAKKTLYELEDKPDQFDDNKG